MSKRLLASILFIALGIGVIVIERGPISGLLGPFFIVLALLLWVVPANTFSKNPRRGEVLSNPIVLSVLGIGLGLLAAGLGAYFLPARAFSWLLILVGVLLAAWFIIRRFR